MICLLSFALLLLLLLLLLQLYNTAVYRWKMTNMMSNGGPPDASLSSAIQNDNISRRCPSVRLSVCRMRSPPSRFDRTDFCDNIGSDIIACHIAVILDKKKSSRHVNPSVMHPNTEIRTLNIIFPNLNSLHLEGHSIEVHNSRWLGGVQVERRTSVSQIRGSIPDQVAAV